LPTTHHAVVDEANRFKQQEAKQNKGSKNKKRRRKRPHEHVMKKKPNCQFKITNSLISDLYSVN